MPSFIRYMAAGVAALAWHGVAQAQDLVYEPVNPSFGGNAFNSAHLLAIANAQNDYDPPPPEDDPNANFDRFVRSLESRLLSSLSTSVANAIFGENAQDEGTIRFGDQTVSFVRTLDGIQLTITNADGSETVITIPTLDTGSDDNDDDDSEGSGKTTPTLTPAFGANALSENSGLTAASRVSEYGSLTGGSVEISAQKAVPSANLNLLRQVDVLASNGGAPIQ